MRCLAPLAVSLALALASSPAFAQEGWVGTEQAAPVAPPPAGAATPPPPGPLAPRAAPAPLPSEHRQMQIYSQSLLLAGIVVTSLGAAGLIGGIVEIVRGNAQPSNNCTSPATSGGGSVLDCVVMGNVSGATNAGWLTLAVAGGITAAGGIVMIGVGAHPVPASSGEPEVWAGPGSAGLRWRF